MHSKRRSPNRPKAVMGCLFLLVSAALSAQSTTPALKSTAQVLKPRMVPLVSGACPVVHGLDRLALDWNPEFEDGAVVIGIRSFTLTFRLLSDDGGHRRFTLGKELRSTATPGANGSFHIEIPVPRVLPPGTYQLVDAHSTPLLPPAYRDRNPEMMNSPIDSGFCFSMTRTPAPAQQGGSSNAQ